MILSIDPSMTCTGWALFEPTREKIVAHGYVCPPEADLFVACDLLVSTVWTRVLEHTTAAGIATVLIETPQTVMFNGRATKAKRSITSLPTYGVVVGAFYGRFSGMAPLEGKIEGVSVSEWAMRYAVRKDDKHKEGRAKLVELLFNLQRGALGPKSYAGNVADAMLMARWWAERQRIGGGK